MNFLPAFRRGALLALIFLGTSAIAAPPANDNFANGLVLTVSGSGTASATSSNIEATAEIGEPAHTGTPAAVSVWWRYTATMTGTIEIETVGSGFDTRLGVYQGASVNALSLIAQNDDINAATEQSRVSFNVTTGQTYHVVVDGFAGATGTIQLAALNANRPANDDFANRTNLGSVATANVTGNNLGATAESGEPFHAGQTPGASIWWRWTAPSAGDVTIDTVGSSFDTMLAVYSGTAVNALTEVISNDDSEGIGTASRVTFTVTAGATYAIVLDSFGGQQGSTALNLVLASSSLPPANDSFAAAAALDPGISASATGTNDHATAQVGEPAHAGFIASASAWWTWTPLASGSVTISTETSGFDTRLAVYTGAAVNALTEVASNDDIDTINRQSRVTFNAVAGTSYKIAVDGFEDSFGAIALALTQTPSAGANDNFASATDLGSGATVNASGVNLGATAEAGEPAHAAAAAAASVWWKWAAPADGEVIVTTGTSSFDTRLAIYTGSALDALTEIASNDDEDPNAGTPILTSAVRFFATAGTIYRIAVDGKNAAAGSINLSLSPAPPTPPPANDDFAAAATLSGDSAVASSTNIAATAQAGEPAHADEPASRSVWWKWTAPANGVVTISTEDSLIDTVLAIYTGAAVNALTDVESNDNAGAGDLTSGVRFRADAGVTYFIAVDGFAGEQGAIELSLTRTNITSADNDDFAVRIDLGSGATVSTTGSNLGASFETSEPAHNGQPAEASVWWSWTAPATGWVAVSTATSDFDTRLAIYTGTTLSALTAIASNDDGATLQAAVAFNATAGATYQIAVDGIVGSEGNIALAIAPTAPPTVANDSFAARADTAGATGIAFEGDNRMASAEAGEPAHGGQPAAKSVWWKWVAPATGRVLFEMEGTFNSDTAIYTGSDLNALTLIAKSTTAAATQAIEFTAEAGTEYQIAVDGAGGASGTFAFQLDFVAPLNDDFADAIDLGNAATVSAVGYNFSATAQTDEPAHAGQDAVASVWWNWTAPATGFVTVSTLDSDLDTQLAVYTGSAVDALTEVASNADFGDDETASSVTFTATAGVTYRIAVDGFAGSNGDISLAIEPGSAPTRPANDDFANAADLGNSAQLVVFGDNINATAQASEPTHAGNPATASVWWKWTAPASRSVALDTLGSAIDTALAVYTGASLASLAPVASNDDADGGTLQSALTFSATAGTVYYFAVDGFTGEEGEITLNLNDAAPNNDDFANRVALNDGSTVSGTTNGATAEVNEPSHASAAADSSVWYALAVPAGNTATITVTPSGASNVRFAAYTGSNLATLFQAGARNAGGVGAIETLVLVNSSAAPLNLSLAVDVIGTTGAFTIGATFVAPPPQGSVGFSLDAETVAENGGSITLIVTRVGDTSGAISVDFATSDGTAVSTVGGDFAASSGTLSFASGETDQTITITINDDTTVEPSENFTVALSNLTGGVTLGVNGTATVAITDNDSIPEAGVLDFVLTESAATETAGTHTITVQRLDGSTGTVSVDYAVTGGTAENESDFTLAAGTLTFADGVESQDISVAIQADGDDEAAETIEITLSNLAGGAALGANLSHEVVITDDDPFQSFAASYTGLINSDRARTGYGSIQFTTTARRSISGKLVVDGVTGTFKGMLDPAGHFATAVKLKFGRERVLAPLILDVSPGSDAFVGTLDEGGSSPYAIAGERNAVGTQASPVVNAGYYTALINADALGEAGEAVRGWVTVTIRTTGKASFAGGLPDGTKLSGSSNLSVSGRLPIAAGLYMKKAGHLSGWLTVALDEEEIQRVNGDLVWAKPLTTKPPYLEIRDQRVTVAGTFYTPPARDFRALADFDENDGAATATISGGDLLTDMAKAVTLTTKNHLTVNNREADKLSLSLNARKGLVTGSFIHSDGKKRKIQGAIVQDLPGNDRFEAFFTGTAAAGSVIVAP